MTILPEVFEFCKAFILPYGRIINRRRRSNVFRFGAFSIAIEASARLGFVSLLPQFGIQGDKETVVKVVLEEGLSFLLRVLVAYVPELVVDLFGGILCSIVENN